MDDIIKIKDLIEKGVAEKTIRDLIFMATGGDFFLSMTAGCAKCVYQALIADALEKFEKDRAGCALNALTRRLLYQRYAVNRALESLEWRDIETGCDHNLYDSLSIGDRLKFDRLMNLFAKW
jgi:hypothetical protein